MIKEEPSSDTELSSNTVSYFSNKLIHYQLSSYTIPVFSPAYVRHVGFASLRHGYSFDVGIGWSLKL